MNRTLEQELRDVNEALLISSVHQHELTEQAEHAEVAMRESNARLESLFDASPVGMYLVDEDLRIRLVSRSARPVFGIIRDLIDSDFVEIIHILWPPASADEIVARFRHTLKTGEPYAVSEFTEVRYDRKVREYYDWQIHRIALPNGRYGVVCYFIDVSSRVLAEQNLVASEIRYRRLFESARDGILILDADTGAIVDANPFMVDLLSYLHSDLLGLKLWEIGLFPDKLAGDAAIAELREKGSIRWPHLSLTTKRGQQIEVELVATAYRETDENVIQCNIRDITDRCRLERKLTEQATALVDLHRRKDEFLAMLSHELRNPLAPISNAVQLLRLQTNEAPLQQQARAIIERQVGQMTRLVNDLLEVSRISTGRIHLHQERVALNGIVDNAVETVSPLIGQHGHILEVSLSRQPIWIYADAARLEQVVINLLTNAAKYTVDGGHIWLSVGQEGDEAVLRVRDSGVGIAPELLPNVFDLFTQAERSLDRAQGGLGIGLSLVQRLVELHRGRVEAHSSLGQGSEFVVHLPVLLSPQLPPVPLASAATKSSVPSLRVLVVDDNIDAATTLGMLLRMAGHDVQTAHNGPAAVEAAANFRPEVVLLDIGLPGFDGFEVAKRIRGQPGTECAVLVAMTGYGQESDRQLSQSAGFHHHLVKPVHFEKVQEILATVVKKVT